MRPIIGTILQDSAYKIAESNNNSDERTLYWQAFLLLEQVEPS